MPQQQIPIPVNYLGGLVGGGIRTGNNATWPCHCGRPEWLVGYSDTNPGRPESLVVCPGCDAEYRVIAPGYKEAVTDVQEV